MTSDERTTLRQLLVKLRTELRQELNELDENDDRLLSHAWDLKRTIDHINRMIAMHLGEVDE